MNMSKHIYRTCSLAIALSGSDALWVLHVGEVSCNGSFWGHGHEVLP